MYYTGTGFIVEVTRRLGLRGTYLIFSSSMCGRLADLVVLDSLFFFLVSWFPGIIKLRLPGSSC